MSAGEDVRAARESLAGVLVDNLSVPGGNAGVSHLSESLLMRLLEACPSLLWSRRAVGKLLAVAGKNGASVSCGCSGMCL